ncbi:MAG TPA: FAD-binding oxidoreductase [Planctomycetota bacterium]|nr:FAD-binding oxidoreductase [Planctomycetota bacterium]
MAPGIATRGPRRSYELVEGWGMAVAAPARVLRPRNLDEIRASFELARRDGVPLGLRGAGNSYGDASVNATGHVLDISRMDRILRWDPATGVAELEPGVTLRQLWRHILPDGWWPRVVSGTMFPTVAGALAMNTHGKNNYVAGTFGDACLEFDIVLPSGEVRTASREREPELFHAAIGGFGMLGCFSRIVLQTHRVHSGNLRVKALRGRNLREVLDLMESRRETADYLVGWIDAFPAGARSGRGLVHAASYLQPGEDPEPGKTLRVSHQELPPTILGFPKSDVWRILRRFNNDAGMRLINAAKYLAGYVEAAQGPRLQSHAGFAFLLDYVPNWKFAYGTEPGRRGLIQFQSFLPHAAAHDTWHGMLVRCRAARLLPYLGVLKRHRSDPFWMTHAVDGWSLALDFKVTPENRARLWEHCRAMSETVIAAGGRFYFAKDLVLGPDAVARFLPPADLERFLALKRRLDPEGLLQTNLSRRVLGALAGSR